MQWVILAAGSSPSIFLHEIHGSTHLSWVISPEKAMKFATEEQAKKFSDAINSIAKTGLHVTKTT